jgi:hypothetical protein
MKPYRAAVRAGFPHRRMLSENRMFLHYALRCFVSGHDFSRAV